jgi:hypothetical protein
MKKLVWVLLSVAAIGCAHGKMGAVDQALEAGAVTKDKPIYIDVVSAKEMRVTGDKADDTKRIDEEKAAIESRYHRMIADELRKKGYTVETGNAPKKSGLVLTGKVSRFEHGSGAARMFVGMGAGSSNMFTDFVLEDRTAKKTLTKFEVIATSGGRGGVFSTGSFMEAHLTDGSKKAASYINGEEKK